MQITGQLEKSKTNPAPKIDVYLPQESNGQAIVILPGGGYGGLAEHEGKGYAEFFSKHGIACFVANYRLGSNNHRHPEMLEDALSAISIVREKADEFKVDPKKVGIMGSSAGGHLCAHTLTSYSEYDEALRPAFGILCYPVIHMQGEFHHAGSRNNLLGENPSDELIKSVAPELKVSKDTPPCFIWHTWNDDAVPVENSMNFASALRKKAIPTELHIYRTGAHGLGLNTELNWGEDCLKWLNEIN